MNPKPFPNRPGNLSMEPSERTLSPYFIALLAMAIGLGPFSMQIFIPALPLIQADLAASVAVTQLTVSISMISIAVATLIYGPLSDQFGRRPVMLAGLVIGFLGSVMCACATDIGWLILGRIVQAAGVAVGMVLSRAIARDLYNSTQAAKVISILTMVMVVAPMIAPVLGGFITDGVGWRFSFVFVCVVVLLVIALIYFFLKESKQGEVSRTAFQSPWQVVLSSRTLLKNKAYLSLVLFIGFSSMIFFGFISGAVYLVKSQWGMSAADYGLYFILISVGFMGGNYISILLNGKVSLMALIVTGNAISVVFVFAVVMCLYLDMLTPLALFLLFSLALLGNGMAVPSAQAEAINLYPHLAGSASGLSGFIQMGLAACAVQIVGLIQENYPFGMLWIVFAAVISAFFTLFVRPQSE